MMNKAAIESLLSMSAPLYLANFLSPHPVLSLGPSLDKRRYARGTDMYVKKMKVFSERVSICGHELAMIYTMKGVNLR